MANPAKPPSSAEELIARYASGEREFRGANLRGVFILTGAFLTGAFLERVDLRDANLERADLRGANLQGANLEYANLQDANLQDANLQGANLQGANLEYANLRDVNLQGANLRGGHLDGANLDGANLDGANLDGANLRGANLRGAHLQGADLRGADLEYAHLQGAHLQGANLEHAKLFFVHLEGAYLEGTTLGFTRLGSVNLTPFCEPLPTLHHVGPSYIDTWTVFLSLHTPRLKEFLVHAGVPEVVAEYMVESARSIQGSVFDLLRSTFISYGHPDEPFARKLYEALHRNGVTTFFFPEHAKAGEKLHRVVHEAVNKHDRVILVCSAASLDRKGLLAELEETLARERRDGGAAYLIPIKLDDYVFDGWQADVAQTIRDRVVADFRGADKDPAKFQSALLKLIGALKK